MKKIILGAAIIFLAPAFFYSCKKEILPPVAPTPPPNLLSGTELTFDDLAWKFYNSGSPDFDEIYLVVPTTPLLNQEIAKGEIFLKYDTSGSWIRVVRQSEAMPDQHIYFFNRENLVVEVYPLNYRLPGRKASVKVQFL